MLRINQRSFVVVFALMFAVCKLQGQPVPSPEENIPYLVTFGKKADLKWGDNDFSQVWFFVVPESFKGMVHIRVFDPDVGGMHDEQNGTWDTRMTYSVYGGKDAFTHPAAKEIPKKNFKTGNLLMTRTFGVDPKYDNNWFTFGPFDPAQGELYAPYGGYVFKMVCEGVDGDDGNMYRYFMSTSATANVPIEGGYAFAYEYKFRMHDNPNEVSHIYPHIDQQTTAIKTRNFDWDNDGQIRVVSEVRREQQVKVSGDMVWAETEFTVYEDEKGKSLDFQFIKSKNPVIRNNNVVITVQNQYGDYLQFHPAPIGGVPKYKYGIEATKRTNN